MAKKPPPTPSTAPPFPSAPAPSTPVPSPPAPSAVPPADPPPRRPRARRAPSPPHVPRDDQRAVARALASVGVPHEVIAGKLSVDLKTLHRHYGTELEEGTAEANAQVVAALFKAATQGSVPAAKWWTQTRLGWRERGDAPPSRPARDAVPRKTAAKKVEDMTDEELITLAARLAETAAPEETDLHPRSDPDGDPDPDGDGDG